MALVAGGVVVAGVNEVLTGAISVLAFLLLLSLEKTPPIASPPTIRAISTTAASAIHGAREAPPWRPGGPPTGPPAWAGFSPPYCGPGGGCEGGSGCVGGVAAAAGGGAATAGGMGWPAAGGPPPAGPAPRPRGG